jgi:hypothetical protein
VRRSGTINIATGGSGGMSLQAILFEPQNPKRKLPGESFTQNRGHYHPRSRGPFPFASYYSLEALKKVLEQE